VRNKWQLPMTIVFLLLGIMLTSQLFQRRNVSDLYYQKTEDLIVMVSNLHRKRYALEAELEKINTRLNELQTSQSDKSRLISNMESEMEKLSYLLTGEELKEPGLEIIFEEDSALLYVDLLNLVNELWAAGAKAISVNDVRLGFNSVFYQTQNENDVFITLDHSPLYFPISIKAAGSPQVLEKGLTLPGGIIDTLTLFGTYPLLFTREELLITANPRTPLFYNARPITANPST